MFESPGEIVVLLMAVMVTWCVAWGLAEWRMAETLRRRVEPAVRVVRAPATVDAIAAEPSSVRVLRSDVA